MTGRGFRLSAAAIIASAAALVATNIGAFAYTSGSIGYDISYPQCGSYQAAIRPAVASKTTAAPPVTGRGVRNSLKGTTSGPQVQSARVPWWTQPRNVTPSGAPVRNWYSQLTWGIVGVDGGRPFNSQNPCLASEYRHTTSPGLYVNTGYDQSYTDANHTTNDCRNQSTGIQATAAQQAAWAVGCSEAEDDYGYASSLGIMSALAWWLDVETGNSWCGQHGVTCDLSLNQFTLRGLIDEFTHIGAVPIGIYSNSTQWSAIMGTFHVTDVSMDWYASGAGAVQTAKAFCAPGNNFSGATANVAIVQFVPPNSSADADYAC